MQRGLSTQYFPLLALENHSVESPESDEYNCIGWACGLNDRSLWPANEFHEWPADLPQEDELQSFIALFQKYGYEICASPDLESGFEKVAVYAINNEPTHAARQLASGKWASKMGYDGVDIEHDAVDNVEGPGYGRAVVFLGRPRG